MLSSRQEELAGEMFDLLLSLSEFSAFKEMMLSYKYEQQQQQGASSSGVAPFGLGGISVCQLQVHTEEQSDGDERPDLDLGISITGISSGPK